jgi:signal transduction histidine kinase
MGPQARSKGLPTTEARKFGSERVEIGNRGVCMHSEPAEQFLLATLPPSPAQRRLALTIVVTLLVAFVVTAPFRTIQLPQSGAFITAFQTVLFVNDLITATLLFAQFSILRWRALLALASGYLFTSLIAIPYALTFPGSFSETGLLGAGYQTAGWLYLIWHCGLPLAVISYALLKGTDRATRVYRGSTRAAIGVSVAVVTTVVCVLTWGAVAAHDVLPDLFLDAVRISPFGQQLSAAVGGLSALALALLWLRWRSVLDLWLLVVLSAWLLEIGFFVLLTSLRFSLAFYTSRMYALITASVVLLVLLSEMTTLYGRLARSIVVQRREREGRMMAMNAMSASVAHELSQPLGAMMANSDAALLWLAKTPPDFTKVRASVERIADDGRRANGVIASLRALFRKEAGKRELLDVNKLVRDVLAIEGAELQRNRVSVSLELAEPVVEVLCDRLQLHQVILNVVVNAVEAMSRVTDRARVLRVKSEAHEQGVLITIEDSGTGIDQKNVDQIFEPFFSTKSHGMGLGLWICRTIIENHHGRLTASPGTDHGAVFQIALPG